MAATVEKWPSLERLANDSIRPRRQREEQAGYSLRLPERIRELFAYAKPEQAGFFGRFQEIVNSLPRVQLGLGGTEYIPALLGNAPAIYAVDRSVVVMNRTVYTPFSDQCTALTMGVGVCGTDLGLLSDIFAGKLKYPHPMVLGHEALVMITGGDPSKIGRYYWLESHYADSMSETKSLDDSKAKGQDGIVTIHGSALYDGTQEDAFPGYNSQVLTADITSVPPFEIPWQMLEYMLLPRLESLGNSQQIVLELDKRGYSKTADKTMVVVFGAGATGTPLAILLKSAGYHVVVVEPTEWRREIAKEVLASDTVFGDEVEANEYLSAQINSGKINQTITAVMTGAPGAYSAAYDLLAQHLPSQQEQRPDRPPNLLVAFGLLPADGGPFPFPNAPNMSGRQIVLAGQSYPMSEVESDLVGVVGRSDETWRGNRVFLPKADGTPTDPDLIREMNGLMYRLPANGDLRVLADLFNQGPAQIEKVLQEHRRIKLGMYLIPGLAFPS